MYYLIESPEEPRWLRVRAEINGNARSASLLWTNNSDSAIQFARAQDAEAFLHLHPEVAFMARVTEHMNIDRAQPANSGDTDQ